MAAKFGVRQSKNLESHNLRFMAKYTEEDAQKWYKIYLETFTLSAVVVATGVKKPTISWWFRKMGFAVDRSRSRCANPIKGPLTAEEERERKSRYRVKVADILRKKELARYYRKKETPEFKARVQAYRDRTKTQRQQYYNDNIEYFKTKAREHYNPGRKYGLTKEEYQARLSCGQCQICATVTKLRLDHCHKTDKIRGALCHGCNVSLGHFKDSIDILKAAIKYLDRNQENGFDPVI